MGEQAKASFVHLTAEENLSCGNFQLCSELTCDPARPRGGGIYNVGTKHEINEIFKKDD